MELFAIYVIVGFICVHFFFTKLFFKFGDIIYEILKKILSLFQKKG